MHRYCLALLAMPLLAHAEGLPLASERDYLGDLPVVLSVSRLPQPIDETPGAVSIIDRDLIRLSGARNIVDLFRLVPGFQVSNSVEGSAPLVAYHGSFNEFSNRMQVLVDGRSVYSAFRLGDVAQGLQTLALEDIDHIEVIRGSDSAAYGARAVLGVVNIVTLDPVETHGVLVGKVGGGNGIDDSLVRIGWGDEFRNFRLTAQRRGDDGLAGAHGANHISNVNFRADFRPNVTDEWQVRAGNSEQVAGRGYTDNPFNRTRELRADWNYLQLDWQRNLGTDADLAISLSHTNISEVDHFFVALLPELAIDANQGGRSSNDAFSLQHTFSPAKNLRLVWGGELRREEVRSVALYNTPQLSTQFRRVFGNLEWRIAPDLVLNAGTMIEHSTGSGTDASPRLMLNWHVTPGQTLRIGTSEGHRPPSMFEKSANNRYVVNGLLLDQAYLASGKVRPENIRASEIGYLADFPALSGSIDLRVFRERVDGIIQPYPVDLPANTQYLDPQQTRDYFNSPAISIHGLEYQFKVHLNANARLLLNESLLRNDAADPNFAVAMPLHQSSLLLAERFSNGVELSLGHYRSGATAWQQAKNLLAPTRRTDFRLGMPFRVGSTRCEGALTAQNLGQPYNDFLPTFQFRRRAFASLTAEF
jgi:iron complex outermembrane receptor protein